MERIFKTQTARNVKCDEEQSNVALLEVGELHKEIYSKKST